jgi:hypothetical protein
MFPDFYHAEDVLLLHPVRSLFTVLYHLSIHDLSSRLDQVSKLNIAQTLLLNT